jgi:hypothetical protein
MFGGGKDGFLIGDIGGVSSKDVVVYVLLRISKLERLDGRVMANDDMISVELYVHMPAVLAPGIILIEGCFVMKRPELSLFCS